MLRWLGLDDPKAAATLIGSVVFVLLLLVALPRYLHRQEISEYSGTPTHTSAGYVSTVTISPISQGGGGLFNAVEVTFGGHRAYYALPKASKWDPIYGQSVTVTYQIGRKSGIFRIDSVVPVPSPKPKLVPVTQK